MIWEAAHVELRRDCALKIMHVADSTSPFLPERIRRTAALEHPNLMPIYDAFTIRGAKATRDLQWAIAMPLVDGEPLHRRIAMGGALSEQSARALVEQVVDGLAHALERGAFYPEIGPSQILVTPPPPSAPERPSVKVLGLVESFSGEEARAIVERRVTRDIGMLFRACITSTGKAVLR